MRLHMIDYIGVSKNGQDGWLIKNNRLGKKMLCCKSTSQTDIIEALCGWGVLPSTSGYKIVIENGQYTIFEKETDKPMCACFMRLCDC